MRKQQAQLWELGHSRSDLAAATGKCPTHEVWLQSVQAETSAGAGKHVVSTFWGMNKFFGWIDQTTLSMRGVAQGLPTPTRKLTIAGFRVPRVVTIM